MLVIALGPADHERKVGARLRYFGLDIETVAEEVERHLPRCGRSVAVVVAGRERSPIPHRLQKRWLGRGRFLVAIARQKGGQWRLETVLPAPASRLSKRRLRVDRLVFAQGVRRPQ